MFIPRKASFLALSLLYISTITMETSASFNTNLIPSLPHLAATPTNAAKLSALAFFIWSGIVFITTEPHNKPVRYSFEELLQQKDILKNLKYLIIDGLIGHKSKRPSMRIYPDGKVSAQLCEAYDDIRATNNEGAVILRPGAYPKGIYGWTYEYVKPTVIMLTFLASLRKTISEASQGIDDWSEYFDVIEQ